MRDRLRLVCLPIAALLAVLPLILRGNSCGHDFEFHLFNWLEVGSQWKQGWLFPHWEFTSAWNSGEPRFIFYPPLSWTIGALLGLALPWAAVPVTVIWLALTACGLTMHRLAREWTGESNAIIASCAYMVHPYMLFTFYERSAYSELLAAAWLPLVLLAVLRPRLSILGTAVAVTLLWLSNDPAAVMGCYTFVVLGVLRVASRLRAPHRLRQAMREAGTMAAGSCLGLGLAAFYLLPATYEQRWIQIRLIMIEGVRVQDNFLFSQFGRPSHRAIVRTASLCSMTLLTLIGFLALAAFLVDVQKPKEAEQEGRRRAVASLLMLALVVGFLLTASSASLWRHAPELEYLQFPWRFNAVLGCVAAAMLALALGRLRTRFSLAIGIALIATLLLSLDGYKLFRQWCNRGNDTSSLVEDFYHGNVFDPTDSYTPAGADHFAIAHANPGAWIAADPGDPAPEDGPRRYSIAMADRMHFEVSTQRAAYFVINLRDYPAWKIAINGVVIERHPHREDGLIALPISSGFSKIDIIYALTWDRIVGWLITVLAVFVFAAIWLRSGPAPQDPPSNRVS